MKAPSEGSTSRRALVFGLLTLAATAGCDKGGGGASSASSAKHPLVGSPAPEFDLPAQAGGARASMGEAKGKVVLVDFWATWCGPCRASFPKYEALAKKFGDDLQIIGVAEDDEPDEIKAFAKETGVSFLLAWDKGKGVAGSYHPDSMPTSFLVDRNGLVRYVHAGFRDGDEAEIESRIKNLIEGS